MRKIAILLSLLMMITLSSVSAEEVIIEIKNGKLAESVDIEKTYSGKIGKVKVKNISDDTLQVEINNFLYLFAQVGSLKLLIDDLLEKISVVDNTGISRPLTVNDVDIKIDRQVSKIYVHMLRRAGQFSWHWSSAKIQCENGYLMGVANRIYGGVKLDGVPINDKVSGGRAYTIIPLSGNHTVSASTYKWGYCHFSIVSLDAPVEVSDIVRFAHRERVFDVSPITYPVSVKVINGLTGNLLSGVRVSGPVSAVIDGTATLQIPRGEHTLTFSKEGYWDASKTINVEGSSNLSLVVEMYPSNSIFMVSQDPAELITYPSSIAEVTLTLRPIEDAYGTKLFVTGVDVVRVKKGGMEIPKSADGSYIIGDVSYSADVKITFAVPDAVGGHQFIARFTASDIRGNQYTTQKTVQYTVQELPFVIQKPSWCVGNNTLTIIEQAGEDYTVLLVLRDANGTEVWTQSMAFEPYDSHTFTIPIPEPGKYVLEISAKGGAVTTYIPITATEPVKLLTPEIEGTEGSVVSVKLEIRNPSSEVRYYDAIVVGSIFDTNNTPKVTFSIAPGESKTVEIKFKIPEGLEFDTYSLQAQVFEKDESEPIFTGDVVLKIKEGGGLFLPIGGEGNNNTLLIIGAIILVVLLVIGILRVRR